MCAALLGLMLAAPLGCGGFGEYCQEFAKCYSANPDEDVAACEADLSNEADRASLFGCSDYFDERQQCWDSRSRCVANGVVVQYTPGDDCHDEDELYQQCMSD